MGKSTKSHPSVSWYVFKFINHWSTLSVQCQCYWCIVNHCFAEIAALTHRGRERVSITYAHMLRVRR